MIFSQKMLGATLFCQSDGGQKGQEVRLFTMFDKNDKTETPPEGLILDVRQNVIFLILIM
jgi:hypothetical protein